MWTIIRICSCLQWFFELFRFKHSDFIGMLILVIGLHSGINYFIGGVVPTYVCHHIHIVALEIEVLARGVPHTHGFQNRPVRIDSVHKYVRLANRGDSR